MRCSGCRAEITGTAAAAGDLGSGGRFAWCGGCTSAALAAVADRGAAAARSAMDALQAVSYAETRSGPSPI
jgi:hypothetical protein